MSFNYTPLNITEKLIKDVNFNENDITLEPCKADGSFYDLIPYEKDWAEIEQGRDIFTYDFGDRLFTKIITNPPYKDNITNKNIGWAFIIRCLELCTDECWLLLNHSIFNGFTPKRLTTISSMGFNLCFIRIINIPKWYGRYYWVCLSKHRPSIVHF